jgi:hypothetical protein
MGRRIHELCVVLTDRYDSRAEALWDGVGTGAELYARLRELPGYGEEKSQIFLALLAKRQGVAPAGWQAAAGKFGDDVPRSVADISDELSLGKVREWKRAAKAAKRDKQDRPLALTVPARKAPAKKAAAAKTAAAAKKAAGRPTKKAAAPAKKAAAKKAAGRPTKKA